MAQQQRQTLEELIKTTELTKNDLLMLQRNFQIMAGPNDKIDRPRFRDMLGEVFSIDDSLIMDRDSYISYEEFVRGMAVFLKGKHEDKLKFCFRVYDLNGDRYISKEEMFQMLKNCLVKEAAEEDEDGVKDLVDMILKKLDEDRDGRVSESDWAGAIAKESLLIEAFGKCLPTAKEISNFLSSEAQGASKIKVVKHTAHNMISIEQSSRKVVAK